MKVGATSMTLLDRLAVANSADAWDQFVELYAPLMLHWNREAGLQEADARDVAQDAMTFIISHIRSFERNREGSFRAWLKRISYNMLRNHRRKSRAGQRVGDVKPEDLQTAGEDFLYAENYYQDVFESALRMLHKEFTGMSWDAFLSTALLNRGVEEVAQELKISANAVYIARHRITTRLSETVREFVEGDDLPALTVDMVERITTQAAQNLRGRLDRQA